jgi:uncharacterized Zn finger protein
MAEENNNKPNPSPEQKSDSQQPNQNRNNNQRKKRYTPRTGKNVQRSRSQKDSPRSEKNQNEPRNGQNQKRPNQQHNGLSNGNRNSNGEQTNTPWGMNPRFTETGIQTRSQRGEFAKNWWARSWLDALENLMQGVRLTRGQHYARLGQIVSMEEIKGGILARVQGSRSKPYRVTIQLNPLSNRQWEKVFDLLADKAIYVAKLLAGDMPEDIEEVFSEAGVSLFPTRSIDLQTKCTCPDKVTPCKHVAATHYILGDRFDEDPFLLFRMRGRTEDQIMEALRQRRGAEADMSNPEYSTPTQSSEAEKPRFPQTLENFWNIGPQIDEVNVQVKMPNLAQPLLKRLGEPEFASQLTLQGQLEESYNSISQFAMIIAYADTTATENGNGDEE